jgi:hypothetical protein
MEESGRGLVSITVDELLQLTKYLSNISRFPLRDLTLRSQNNYHVC